jgi:hypothetical protein
VLVDHLVPASHEVVAERSLAVDHFQVVAAHAANLARAADRELVVGQSVAVVRERAVAVPENLEQADLHMEENHSLVAPVVQRAAAATTEAVSHKRHKRCWFYVDAAHLCCLNAA